MEDRILTNEKLKEDQNELSIRPEELEEYIGEKIGRASCRERV